MELVLLVVTVATLAGAAAFAAARWPWLTVVKRRVLVQTDSDVSFVGVLMQRRGQLLVLADVTVRTAGEARADGLVVIERSRVLWIQVAT